MFFKIISVCLILLQCSVQIQSLECPNCIDYRYKFFDMPDINEEALESALKSFGNILCRTNTHNATACRNSASYDYIDKCMDVFSTVVVKGIKGYDDNAGMKLETIVRSCTSRPKDEPDNCVDFTDIDGYDSATVEGLLNMYTKVYNSVTLNGQVCYNSIYTKGYQQPLQKASANWLDSFANRVHVSSVLYVISFMFSLKLFL